MMKTAIVLFNLGGPDTQEAVKPFLFNLFYDPAIISAPKPVRLFLAWMISSRRASKAREIYAQIGGGSPILEETGKQARALEASWKGKGDARVFICMRYWHPMTRQTVAEVKDYAPDRIVLLPLYPQYSTTTTQSSFDAWEREANAQKLEIPTRRICCYPQEKHFIAAHADLIRSIYFKASAQGMPRILFSAHGLPEKVIARGDPYQWQVEQTVRKIVEILGIPDLDYRICYQSRVGPLTWIGPATDDEIRQAGKDGVPLIVTPVAFVSEHSETLVELDIEYRHLAEQSGVKGYWRVPALGTHPDFISALAHLSQTENLENGGCVCPASFSQCPKETACIT